MNFLENVTDRHFPFPVLVYITPWYAMHLTLLKGGVVDFNVGVSLVKN